MQNNQSNQNNQNNQNTPAATGAGQLPLPAGFEYAASDRIIYNHPGLAEDQNRFGLPVPEGFWRDATGRITYNKILIESQKEYIRWRLKESIMAKKMYDELRKYYYDRRARIIFLVKIESTKPEYLPTEMDEDRKRALKWIWAIRRMFLKIEYFFRYDLPVIAHVVEQLVACVVRLADFVSGGCFTTFPQLGDWIWNLFTRNGY